MKPRKQTVERVRRELLTQGFSLVNTTKLLKDCVIPHRGSIAANRIQHIPDDDLLTISFSLNEKYDLHSKKPMDVTRFVVYIEFMNDLLQEAVHDESFHFSFLDLRTEKGGGLCNWHIDGGYFRMIAPILGPCTQYQDAESEVFEIPQYQTLIMTGCNRPRQCRKIKRKVLVTSHKAPITNRRRQLVVGHFDSGKPWKLRELK